MSYSGSQGWMYRRLDDRGYLTPEFLSGLHTFTDFCLSTPKFIGGVAKFRCPCKRCRNEKYVEVDELRLHLTRNGFLPDYYIWDCHGESHHAEAQTNEPVYPDTKIAVTAFTYASLNPIVTGTSSAHLLDGTRGKMPAVSLAAPKCRRASSSTVAPSGKEQVPPHTTGAASPSSDEAAALYSEVEKLRNCIENDRESMLMAKKKEVENLELVGESFDLVYTLEQKLFGAIGKNQSTLAGTTSSGTLSSHTTHTDDDVVSALRAEAQMLRKCIKRNRERALLSSKRNMNMLAIAIELLDMYCDLEQQVYSILGKERAIIYINDKDETTSVDADE